MIISSGSSGKKLLNLGYKEDQIIDLDITEGYEELEKAFAGCDTVILVTSAVPRVKITSFPGMIWAKIRGEKKMPEFSWKKNQPPEAVRG